MHVILFGLKVYKFYKSIWISHHSKNLLNGFEPRQMEDLERNGSSTDIIQALTLQGCLGITPEAGAVPGACNLTLSVQSCPEMEHMNVFKNSVRKGSRKDSSTG